MQEDKIIKINEIDIAHDKSHVSFWYKQSNVRVESEHPIIDFKINDQSHIRVNFEDSGLTVYVQNVNVWHSPQVDESLRQWMNITVILDSTTKILDIQVYNRKGEEVFDSIPLIKLNNVKQLLKAGENSGTVHIGDLSNNSPNSFMLYNLVCGLGGLSDELSQAPSKFPRSCKEGTLESGCYKSLDIELIFAEFNEIPNPEYTFQPLFTLTNLALEYSRSFIYAPSFSFNLRLENLDFETFETNKEVLFAIAGGATLETIGNLTNINEYDVSKSNFAIIVENKKLLKGYVNTRSHTLIVNLNPDMNDQHKLPTDVNINFIFDGVRNLLTVRYDADDFTSVVSHHNLNFEPITSASNIYKKHGQGHAILNLRGQPIVDSESLTSKRESTFCNREQSRALTCEYVHKFQTALALTCEDGWTVNEGLCVKTNTLN